MKKPLLDQFERMVMRERPKTLWSQRMMFHRVMAHALRHLDQRINNFMKPSIHLYVLMTIIIAFLVATVYLCRYFDSMLPLLLMLVCPTQIKQSTKP